MDEKIIQIIPAPKNLNTVYYDDDTNEEFTSKVVCLGLTDKGDVVLMDIDDMGEIMEPSGNCTGIKWGD